MKSVEDKTFNISNVPSMKKEQLLWRTEHRRFCHWPHHFYVYVLYPGTTKKRLGGFDSFASTLLG